MVQFQKGLSDARFEEMYGGEEQCHAALVQSRWPDGFECPDCGSRGHCIVNRGARRLFQCNVCRKQAGPNHIRLQQAAAAHLVQIFLLTQSKKGISSIELGRRLDVTQTAAWVMKHKLAQVMLERNASKRLKGAIQMDDASIGGARPGRRGRGAKGKTPFVAAVATTEDGKPDQIILRPVKAFSLVAIRKLAATALAPDAQVLTKGLACFAAVVDVGCTYTAIKTGAGLRAAKTPSSGSTRRWATRRQATGAARMSRQRRRKSTGNGAAKT